MMCESCVHFKACSFYQELNENSHKYCLNYEAIRSNYGVGKCDFCIHNPVCDHNRFGWENCGHYKGDRSKEAIKLHQQQYYREKYNARKENHQCVVCGCELEAGETKIKCKVCRQIASFNSKKFYDKKKSK